MKIFFISENNSDICRTKTKHLRNKYKTFAKNKQIINKLIKLLAL
jgi:hypothetical protein